VRRIRKKESPPFWVSPLDMGSWQINPAGRTRDTRIAAAADRHDDVLLAIDQPELPPLQ